MPFLHCISSFEGTFYKDLSETSAVVSQVLTVLFIKIYEKHSPVYFLKHYLKKDFSCRFSFFKGFTQPPTCLTAKIC